MQNDIHKCDAMIRHGGSFHLKRKNHSKPSRVPRDSKIGTDFQKSLLCNYTKFQVASINNNKVIRGGAGANSK